jgi:hypothetical protein
MLDTDDAAHRRIMELAALPDTGSPGHDRVDDLLVAAAVEVLSGGERREPRRWRAQPKDSLHGFWQQVGPERDQRGRGEDVLGVLTNLLDLNSGTIPTVTAQEEFKALMKDHIGPRLRDLGWRGSGANWLRPHRTQWVLLGWQKSRDSTAASVEFTGNLSVVAKDAWDAENVPHGRRPERPSPTTSWMVGWERRIGQLIPGTAGDRWWFVRPGDDLEAIAGEVVGAVTTYAIPAIERVLADAESKPHLCWHNVGGHNWFQPCNRPADAVQRLTDRDIYRCAEHAPTQTK